MRIRVTQLTLFPMNDHDKTFSFVCRKLKCENNTPAWPDIFGRAIDSWLASHNEPKIRTLSLFSGAGGLDIGFSDLGFEIISSVEIEPKFCDTLELNTGEGKKFLNSKVNCVDIRDFSGDNLGIIDFIIGGPPCQTFSAAGRRANGVLGTSDARGVLFREYVRLLQKLTPKGFLFENVYGIVGAQGGKPWQEIIKAFSDVGYRLFYRILDAADYGVPQHRERMIIVGLRDGEFRFPRPTHGPDSLDKGAFYNAGTAIDGVEITENIESNKLSGRFASLLDAIPPGLNYSFYTEEMGHPNPIFAWRSKFSDFLYKADPNEPVRTIKASGGAYTGPLHWENRFFTLDEYKRLQTFPDNYQISGGKQIAVKQIGNSVPPQLARIMALAIRHQIFGTQFPFELSYLNESELLTFRKRKHDLTKTYREKAKIAINKLKDKNNIIPKSHQYYCSISDIFKLYITNKEDAEYYIVVQWDDSLVIIIEDKEGGNCIDESKITITGRNNGWGLNVNVVELVIKSNKKLAFTVAWKAFEREIIENGIKADLVQLNGYYQYVHKFLCRYEPKNNSLNESVLKSVVEGNAVARIVSTKDLSSMWNISTENVIEMAEYLKSIGYEIRNNFTNPQIEKGYWLIPYSFPTLSPLSVQLWKKLK